MNASCNCGLLMMIFRKSELFTKRHMFMNEQCVYMLYEKFEAVKGFFNICEN